MRTVTHRLAILMMLGLPDPIVRKLTGHRSRELERYQHLTPELRAMTVNLIATELFRAKRAKMTETGTPTGTVRKPRAAGNRARREVLHSRGVNGGVDGTRARRPSREAATVECLRSGHPDADRA